MKKVFTDFHHAGLLQSLILLFENRLGGELYRPIGREWFDRGFWKVYDHPATVEQFLGIGGNTPDGSRKLNEVVDQPTPETYLCHDIDSDTTNRAITYAGFMNTPFDIVIASLPVHVEPFKKLCAAHPNHPKLIFQIGNAWTIEAAQAPNIMASAIVQNVPANINYVQYHQEFDTKVFAPSFTYPAQNVYSFVNCFDSAEHYKNDHLLFEQVAQTMPGWSFKIYGGQCRDGAIGPASKLAQTMCEARFIWHTKFGGDGYGHIIHNAPAVARPLVVKCGYYVDKLAAPLLIDGETCVAIDGLDYQQIVNKIEYYSDPHRYRDLCDGAYEQFCKVVDFKKEQTDIELFLTKLV